MRKKRANREAVAGVVDPMAGVDSSSQLGERELFLLVAASAIVFIAVMSLLGGWRSRVLRYGDNQAYVEVASAIRHWNFGNLGIQHFMGYPYFMAAVSLVFRVPMTAALWLVAIISSFLSVFVVSRLFGTWTAAYFALTNFAWLQLSFIGGSEPLAVALGMSAFYLFRREKLFAAVLLASLAVTVRPLMIFALVGIGLVLLYRRQFRAFAIALGTGLAVGALYVLPLALYFGDVLLTVHSYTSRDYGAANLNGPHGRLFGWPFHGIVVGTMLYPAPWTNLILSFFWIFLVLAGIAMMFSMRFRVSLKKYPQEGIFCALYLLMIFCYDYLVWARGSFIRFSIPALPFVFFALMPWLPKNRMVVWGLSVACAMLAAASAVGIRNVVK